MCYFVMPVKLGRDTGEVPGGPRTLRSGLPGLASRALAGLGYVTWEQVPWWGPKTKTREFLFAFPLKLWRRETGWDSTLVEKGSWPMGVLLVPQYRLGSWRAGRREPQRKGCLGRGKIARNFSFIDFYLY